MIGYSGAVTLDVMQITDRVMRIKVASVTANERASRLYWLREEGTNMIKKLKLAFIAAILATIGGISSPVLAAYYDAPAFTGGGSSGYNASNATDN